MWDLAPQKISSVIDDPSIALPRFQRKATWTPRQMFDLALSFHARFPLGTMVVKVDGDSGKYLLDGRQRREALQRLRDPEHIYDWAKSTLNLTNRDSDHDIRLRFYDYVADYFGTEHFERDDNDSDSDRINEVDIEESDETQDDPQATMAASEDATPYSVASEAVEAGTPGGVQVVHDLDEFLEVILLAHPKRQRTQFVRRFDNLASLFSMHPVARKHDGIRLRVESERLWKWVLDWWREVNVPESQFRPSMQDFVDRLASTGSLLQEQSSNSLAQYAQVIWPEVERTIRVIVRTEQRLIDTKIGLLEITSGSHAAERKIFELINSAGSPLTAAEILSARHSWNAPLPHADAAIDESAARLYGVMGIPLHRPLVHWDQAATLMDRIEASMVFGDLCGSAGLAPPAKGASGRFERRITLGFKLMAGWYAHAIDKDTIASLHAIARQLGEDVPWGSTQLEVLLGHALQKAADQQVFRMWSNWTLTLVGHTSDAAALNFVLLIATDWQRKGAPHPGGTFDQFQRNARILLDRSVYEYVSGLWGGSGDSRIRQNLRMLATEGQVMSPVPDDDWNQLLEGVFAGRLRGSDYTGKVSDRVALLLLYRNVLRGITLSRPPAGGKSGYEIDHIIPQEAFAPQPRFVSLMHHIGNLAPIPADLNLRKRNRRLNEISDPVDRDSLAEYEDVPVSQFAKYSAPEAAEDLVEWRVSQIRGDFKVGRARHILG